MLGTDVGDVGSVEGSLVELQVGSTEGEEDFKYVGIAVGSVGEDEGFVDGVELGIKVGLHVGGINGEGVG